MRYENRNWSAQRERSTPQAIAVIRWVAINIGRTSARCLLYPITLYYLLFSPLARQASRNYLSLILGYNPSWLQIAKHIHTFASTILDRVYFLTGRLEKLDIRFPNKELPLSFSKQGKGFLLLGSHIGSFEVLRGVASKFPVPIKIMMDAKHNPMIVSVLNALNPDLKDMVIPLGRPDSLIRVKECLDAGHVVGMLGDRVTEHDKTTTCQLLGKSVKVNTAPIVLAAALKTPIIVFFGLYLGTNRYETHFELLSEKIELNRSNREEEIQHWMQRYVSTMERYIKQAPYNWFNFYDYWGDN